MVISRVTGLSGSGIDIDAQVKALMNAQRAPLNKLKQKKQVLEWQRDQYREMNSLLIDYRNGIGNLKLPSTYATKKSSSSREDLITVSASSSAAEGKYSIRVTQLAEPAQLTSGDITIGAGSESTKLSDLGLSADTTITVSGEKGVATIAVKPSDTLAELMKAVGNKSSITGVNANYDANLDRIFFTSVNTGSTAKIDVKSTDSNLLTNILKLGTTSPVQQSVSATKTYSDSTALVNGNLAAPETLRISYDGTNYDLNITNTTKIGDLINSINSSGLGAAGVKAYLNEKGQLTLSNPDRSKAISFSDATAGGSTVLADLGLTTPTTTNLVGQKVTSSKTYVDASLKPDSSKKIDDTLTADQTLRISYNGKDYNFTINKETSIGELVANINNTDLGRVGVTAYLDSNGKLTFYNPDDTKSLTFSDQTSDSKDITSSLGLNSVTTTNNLSNVGLMKMGIDSKVEYNGVPGTYKSNTFSIAGMTFTAKQVTPSAVDINITKDVDAVFETIKDFVTKYNETIDKVNGKLMEKRYRDYAPLTDEQRENMKEDEIKAWEKKAQSGLLHSDSILSSAMDKFRSHLTSPVTGTATGDIKQLTELGITTGTYTERGKLYITDEAKLKKALGERPEQVVALFTKSDGNSTADSADGLAVRLYNELSGTISKLTSKAGSSLSVKQYDNSVIGKDLNRIDKDVTSMNRRMQSIEDRYYRQFTAMEKALSQINSQGDYMLQQFSNG